MLSLPIYRINNVVFSVTLYKFINIFEYLIQRDIQPLSPQVDDKSLGKGGIESREGPEEALQTK